MINITNQYRTPDNLTKRISIHEKYSVNTQPFGDWIYSHYCFHAGMQILELGCGTADMWKGRKGFPQPDVYLTLTDLSPGMLAQAKQNTSHLEDMDYEIVDIQSMPFADASFDMVIANMMLYHVPDLHRGLCEVRRVLKPGGVFYAATYGEHGIMEFINTALKELNIRGEIGRTFTLQNGAEILGRHFADVKREEREDGLAVTDIKDFVDYVCSLSSLTGIDRFDRDVLSHLFAAKCENGILYVPKEYGMFICK